MYSLHDPLPADVIAHAAGPFAGYRRFPVFSAPWLLRRCLIVMPLTGGLGVLQGTLIGFTFGDAVLGWETAAVSIPCWITFGSAGPALATLARHRLPPARLTVTLAILLGIALSFYCQHLANLFNQSKIFPRYMAVLPGFDPSRLAHPSTLFLYALVLYQLVLFSLVGGGVALLAFHRERRWWLSARHARELAVLSQQRAEAPLEALVDHLRVTLPKLRTDVARGSRSSSTWTRGSRCIRFRHCC